MTALSIRDFGRAGEMLTGSGQGHHPQGVILFRFSDIMKAKLIMAPSCSPEDLSRDLCDALRDE
jgi:hypothetical protein